MYRISHDNGFTLPVIDVQATSKRLKEIREKRGFTVADIQKIFGMQNPQSIYTWENPNLKYLPCLENLIALAKIYGVSIDDLIVIEEDDSSMYLCDSQLVSCISEDIMMFIKNNASKRVQEAIWFFYN
jgi:transcriptional regulator with XRE-family HTH domain